MRPILVDRARGKAAVRHGGGQLRLDLDKAVVAAEASDESVVLVNEALEKLAAHDAATAELVKLLFLPASLLRKPRNSSAFPNARPNACGPTPARGGLKKFAERAERG